MGLLRALGRNPLFPASYYWHDHLVRVHECVADSTWAQPPCLHAPCSVASGPRDDPSWQSIGIHITISRF